MKNAKLLFLSYTIVLSGYAQNDAAKTPASDLKPVLLEKIEFQPGKLGIPYEKWQLPNGLKLIIHEDHSDPIVDVQVAYHVGSNRETPGKSGFAHFFEHMMFQGSEHIKDEEHFQIISSSGGTNNGYTTNDKTVYLQTLPSNHLETALWLEADRMGFLLDSVTTNKFEVQRKTVKNEKFQNQINQPYGLMEEIKGQNLYPQGHPYSWPVIGYTDDLDRANVNDLKNFFLRWYVPNNAILTVAGDVDPKEVLDLTVKYFGSIPSGRDVANIRVAPVIVPEDRYANSKDDVYLPATQMVFAGAPKYHRDEASLGVLAAMMGQGRSSLFYKNFVKSNIAAEAVVFHNPSELSGEFTVLVVAYPMTKDGTPISFNDIETLIRKTIKDFGETGITEEALKRIKASVRAQTISRAESIAAKATILADWELYGRKYNLQDEIDRVERITLDDLKKMFEKYIMNKNAVFVNVWPLPHDQDNKKFKKESFNPYSNIETKESEEYKGLEYKKAKDDFDRNMHPAVKKGKPAVIPDFYNGKFDNGLQYIGTTTSESPMIGMLLTIKGAHLFEDGKKVKSGTANLTASIMNEGTVNLTAEEISAKLELLGSTINFNGGADETMVFVQCLKENIDATLKLLEEKLLTPGFREDEFKRLKKQMLAEINDQKSSGQVTTQKVFNKLMYGNTPLGTSSTGTYDDVWKIDVGDTKAYYEAYYSPNVTNFVVVGDITEQEILPKIEFLKRWKSKNVTLPVLTGFPSVEKTQIYVVHQSDFKTTASQIRIGHHAHPYDALGVQFKCNLMNYALGGNFNSRINLNLREDKGFTYGAFSGFNGNKYTGIYSAGATIGRSSATDSAVVEFFKEIKRYRDDGIKNDELNHMKNAYLLSDVLNYETLFDKGFYLDHILSENLPKDYKKQQADIINNITTEEINQLAKQNINPDKMVILVVGNKYLIQDQLEKIGYGKVKELDKEGN